MNKKFIGMALSLAMTLTATTVPSVPAFAANTLTVDCQNTIRSVTHCASGSLYGVTENKPVYIAQFVAPLKPNVFTNPALSGFNHQQYTGAAIPTAKRLTGTTGRVMIRLADIFRGWPYAFTNMNDWLSKVSNVINQKKASGCTNFYGYEIWNEPDGTWKSNSVSFNNMWLQTYKLIRSQDPTAQIIGPSYSYYNHYNMNAFLNFCRRNNCVPDVICWHELGGSQNISNNIRDLKNLERSFGIPEKKISINEYSDSNHYAEGQPGASAPFIAKFERNKVDAACISWWWTNAPGRLGSLMASDTQKGAGWWFYKWYGDMTGNMVNVTPPNDNSKQVDGFSCVDSNAKYISVLLGGVNDGTINVNLKNIPAFVGSTATVKVEKVDWQSKDTPVNGTSLVSLKNYSVSNNSINVSISNTNNTSGYRVYITPSNSTNPSNPTTLNNGWYRIKNVHANKYLQVAVNTGRAAQNVELDASSGAAGQKWYLNNIGNGCVTLKSALGNFMLDVCNGANNDGTNVEIYNAYGHTPQQFSLKPSGNGNSYVITTMCSNGTKALDDSNYATNDGANVCQWSCTGGDNQFWTFEPAN
ncbi:MULTISPECIES: RICIN domain-containing protein [Clostridium]|uniref:RICIN domain-containing protein n=1 Tax=Clostridium TaxID=1485 RepID=UPI000B089BC5|nr:MULTISPECIES: RICIN domain-containing protein [Clostridium]